MINKGVYQESKSYEGLIAMTLSDDSPKGNEMNGKPTAYKTAPPLFLYLHDSAVYSPGFIKEN